MDGSSVVLGLGGCLDYEIAWDLRVVEELIASYDIGVGDLIPGAAIRSERDLLVSILSYVAAGTGGERYVESSAALAAFSARFRGTTTLGGTNVRAGLVMAALEVPSTLYLFGIDDEFRRLLPASISYTSSGEGGRMFPHLIVQLYRGDKIRCRDATLTVQRSDFPSRIQHQLGSPQRVGRAGFTDSSSTVLTDGPSTQDWIDAAKQLVRPHHDPQVSCELRKGRLRLARSPAT